MEKKDIIRYVKRNYKFLWMSEEEWSHNDYVSFRTEIKGLHGLWAVIMVTDKFVQVAEWINDYEDIILKKIEMKDFDKKVMCDKLSTFFEGIKKRQMVRKIKEMEKDF